MARAIAALKKSIEDTGRDVLLVDAGDHIQGTAYGSMDDGATIIELMNEAGYDLATPGNHEFGFGRFLAKWQKKGQRAVTHPLSLATARQLPQNRTSFVKEIDTEFTVFSCDKWGTVLSCK